MKNKMFLIFVLVLLMAIPLVLAVQTNETQTSTYEKLFISDLGIKAIAVICLMFALYAIIRAALGFFGGD